MNRLDLPAWLLFPYLFILGAIVGSFLNVCIFRIPQREGFWDSLRGLWDRPSNCPRCRTPIRWYDNLPIVGWIRLRGRCRNCRMWISLRYPLIELLTASLFVLVYWLEVPLGWHATLEESCLFAAQGPQTVPGLGGLSTTWFLHLRYAYHMVLICALIVATFIDFDLRIIPDGSTLPALAVGLIGAGAIGRVQLVPAWFQSPTLARDFRIILPDWLQPILNGPAMPEWYADWPHVQGLLVSVAGAVVGAGMTWIVRVVGRWVLKTEAMGDGDVVLMGVIGSFLGWQPTVIAFFIAPVCALVVVAGVWLVARATGAKSDRYIPYGPYLSLGTLVVILCFRPIWAGVERIFLLGPLLIVIVLLMFVMFVANLMALQWIKRLLGLGAAGDEQVAEWTSADQHLFQSGERRDRHIGAWRPRGEWPGTAASQGTLHVEKWRRPD